MVKRCPKLEYLGRYRLKEGYKEVEFEVNQETVCVEDVKGKELWLLRVSPQVRNSYRCHRYVTGTGATGT